MHQLESDLQKRMPLDIGTKFPNAFIILSHGSNLNLRFRITIRTTCVTISFHIFYKILILSKTDAFLPFTGSGKFTLRYKHFLAEKFF